MEVGDHCREIENQNQVCPFKVTVLKVCYLKRMCYFKRESTI